MPTIGLTEDECTLILIGLEAAHTEIQRTDPNWQNSERCDAINRLEERIKEAE
jgi:hypothetical protein